MYTTTDKHHSTNLGRYVLAICMSHGIANTKQNEPATVKVKYDGKPHHGVIIGRQFGRSENPNPSFLICIECHVLANHYFIG